MKKYLKALIVLFVIGVLSIIGASSGMAAGEEAYVVFKSDTLTFYYDTSFNTVMYDAKWEVGTGSNPGWTGPGSAIKKVIFNDSFKNYTGVKTTKEWFSGLSHLTTITSLTNL